MTKRNLLHAFWLTFDDPQCILGSGLGVGVTGYTLDDALSLLRQSANVELPPVASVREDVKIADLDQGHVVPNMHPIAARGVWFPKSRPFS